MGTEIVAQKNFEERMKDRIREDIGKLMTDEELSQIVKRAMEEIFFTPRKINDGWNTKEEPPFVHQIIKELLESNLRSIVSAYIIEHNDEVIKTIKDVIKQGMGKALVDAISYQFSNEMSNFQNNILSNLQSR